MPQQNYEERRQARIDRLAEKAKKTRETANQLHDQAHRMASVIPFGQPILVGHHSERRDRNYRKRISNTQDKAFEASGKADHYAQKASAAESNKAISSDDPEAIEKLKIKINNAEKMQDIMKQANKLIKSKKMDFDDKIIHITCLGITATRARQLFEPDFCGRIGFPSYRLTNNNANIRRMKQRLEELQREEATAEHKETEYKGFTVIENVDENRIQIVFDGKDAYFELCKNKGINLRQEGFKYSKHNNAWQRLLNNAGRWATKHVIERINNT